MDLLVPLWVSHGSRGSEREHDWISLDPSNEPRWPGPEICWLDSSVDVDGNWRDVSSMAVSTCPLPCSKIQKIVVYLIRNWTRMSEPFYDRPYSHRNCDSSFLVVVACWRNGRKVRPRCWRKELPPNIWSSVRAGPRHSTRCGTTIYVVDCLRNRILVLRLDPRRSSPAAC